VLRETRIAVQARNLESAQRKNAGSNFAIGTSVETFEFCNADTLDARNSLCCGEKFAEINSSTKGEIVWIEKSGLSIRKQTIAEGIEQRRFHMSTEVVRQNTDIEAQVDGDVTCGTDDNVVTQSAEMATVRKSLREGVSEPSGSTATSASYQLPFQTREAAAAWRSGLRSANAA